MHPLSIHLRVREQWILGDLKLLSEYGETIQPELLLQTQGGLQNPEEQV